MESKVVDLLIQNVRDNKKDFDSKIAEIHDQIAIVDEKIDELLAFKWQILGASMVVSILVGLAVNVIGSIIGKGLS